MENESQNRPELETFLRSLPIADAASAGDQVDAVGNDNENDTNTVTNCPTDVIEIIAEFLAGDGDFDTLSRINRLSRDVHEGTLPVLYETASFDDERAVERSLGFVKCDGWKYTKFLFVTEITLPLIRLLLRYHTKDLPPSKIDLQHLFPKLALVVTKQLCKDNHLDTHIYAMCNPYHLTLFRTLPLSVLMNACKPFGRYSSDVGINFFGTYHPDQAKALNGEKIDKFRDIVGLTVKAGASVSRLKGLSKVKGWHKRWVGTSFKLEIEDDNAGSEVDGVLKHVLAHLSFYVEALQRKVKGKQVHLDLKCSAAVLERFTEMYHVRQPFYLELNVELTTVCDISAIQRYITALAAAYSLHWRHQPLEQGLVFVKVTASANGALPEWAEFGDIVGDGLFPAIIANLIVGNQLAAPEQLGFLANVAQTLLYNGRSDDHYIVWGEPYFLGHIPVALPTAEELQDMPAHITHQWDRIVFGMMAQHGGGRPAAAPVAASSVEDVN